MRTPTGKPEQTQASSSAEREAAADAALAEYLERTERGEAVDREAFLGEHADVADELRSFFDADLDFSTLLDSVLPEEALKESTPAGIEVPRLASAPDRESESFVVDSQATTIVHELPPQRRRIWLAAAGVLVLIVVVLGSAAFVGARRREVAKQNAVVNHLNHGTPPRRFVDEAVAWDGKPAPVKPRVVVPRAEKLVGHWDFTTRPADKVPDLSGFRHEGVLSGGPEWLGKEEGLKFDGVDDCVALANPPQLDFDGAISMVLWLKLESTDGLRNVLAHGHAFSPAAGVFVRISAGQYQAGSWGPGGDHLAAAPVPASDLGQWIHLAGVYDGKAWRLYLQGKLAATREDPIGSMPVADDWAIGACGNRRERCFRGQLRDVRIYDRAITAEEVAELHRGS
jgi:hypothetical protein